MEKKIETSPQLLVNAPVPRIKTTPGEYKIMSAFLVRDCSDVGKQNGELYITNMRVIWLLTRHNQTNISIPFEYLYEFFIEDSDSLTNQREKIVFKVKMQKQKYRFKFSIRKPAKYIFDILSDAFDNFNNSILLRDYFLRTSLFDEQKLILLNDELVLKQFDGVSHFSGDSVKLGCIIVTNRRFIWYSTIIANFNLTTPLILLSRIAIKKSKMHGPSFKIALNNGDDVSKYGFTYPDESVLSEIVSLLNKAIESAKENPMLTYYTPSPVFKTNEKLVKDPTKNKDKSEFFVIEDEDALLRYADDDYDDYFNENIVFEKFLGLSIEASKYVKNISKLWRDAAN